MQTGKQCVQCTSCITKWKALVISSAMFVWLMHNRWRCTKRVYVCESKRKLCICKLQDLFWNTPWVVWVYNNSNKRYWVNKTRSNNIKTKKKRLQNSVHWNAIWTIYYTYQNFLSLWVFSKKNVLVSFLKSENWYHSSNIPFNPIQGKNNKTHTNHIKWTFPKASWNTHVCPYILLLL